jgi:hypothetical protein
LRRIGGPRSELRRIGGSRIDAPGTERARIERRASV